MWCLHVVDWMADSQGNRVPYNDAIVSEVEDN